jgi:hypothetical protein
MSDNCEIKSDLIQFFLENIDWWVNFFGSAIPLSYYREKAFPNMLHHPEQNDFWKNKLKEGRKRVMPAMQIIFRSLIENYFKEGQTVLEIGANDLDNHHSYLSQFFQSVPLAWTFSDAPAIAQRNRYASFDLSDTAPLEGGDLFDRVIGCNVLDTIPYADISMALEKIHLVLKPGQLFFHVADLNFFATSFLDACSLLDGVLFPASNSINSIYRIERDVYRRILEESRPLLSEMEMKFFQIWGQQNTQIQAYILNDAVQGLDVVPLSNAVRKVFCDHLQIIGQVEMFENELKKAAIDSGWEILESGFRSAVQDIFVQSLSFSNETKKFYNFYEQDLVDRGIIRTDERKMIPPGQERLQVKAHLWIARAL